MAADIIWKARLGSRPDGLTAASAEFSAGRVAGAAHFTKDLHWAWHAPVKGGRADGNAALAAEFHFQVISFTATGARHGGPLRVRRGLDVR